MRNNKSVYSTLGASSHSKTDRAEYDYYATAPIAIDVLLDEGGVILDKKVWECSCGEGHLSERLVERGVDVYSTDLIDRGFGDAFFDFLKTVDKVDMDILTNPPYELAQEFIEHAMKITTKGNRIFMFLKVQFLEGKRRKSFFRKYPPKTIYVSSSRILCAKNGDFLTMRKSGGSAVAYAWYEFVNGYQGETTVKWIN